MISENMYSKYLSGNLIGPVVFDGEERFNESTVYSQVCPDCDHKWHGMAEIDVDYKDFPNDLISYSLNNYGYRCDDFNSQDAENNFLFSGCSVTYGVGVPYNASWAYQLNKSLGGEKFFNLAINGGSIKTCIVDIQNYITKFGKPKAVFLMLPNIARYYFFDTLEDGSFNMKIKLFNKEDRQDPESKAHAFDTIMTKDVLLFNTVHDMLILEQYLKAIGVPFFWTTWARRLKESFSKIPFENYFEIDGEALSFIYDEVAPKELTKTKYWSKSRDILHPPVCVHYAYYKFFKKEWNERSNTKDA